MTTGTPGTNGPRDPNATDGTRAEDAARPEDAAAHASRWYRDFAEHEAPGNSPLYGALAAGVADDPELIDRLATMPRIKRQPNILFGAVRFLDGPIDTWPAFREWTLAHWDRVAAVMTERRTQTNEVGRCAALLPVLAALPQPLALIEVGASAGLCLQPDRYRYRYRDADGELPPIGPVESPVVLDCGLSGPVPVPKEPPAVAWRAGIDLNPLNPADPDDARWLTSLVWPGEWQRPRAERLAAALRVAAADPPPVLRGDLNETVAGLIDRVPLGTTPVVFHSAVLMYLDRAGRDAFARTVLDSPAHWLCNESPGVYPDHAEGVPPVPEGIAGETRSPFLLALDGRPIAWTAPHGQFAHWLG
ncbi:DUF2332 domain-containing protein [Streptomyces sp. ST2-7A]|uniref:DUF2332 domain-containing protein n=1 Tax=Streptomyces sp. ST2-7A TaxID=2907214 RepID=UPI001F20F111|nr:DUF2332 domain-containing protein [Streptomyces sp. ST2-7A]MCE7080548.1 DUF2332 domain-containing protein [Streptomyces sp. ST2-7A]